MSWPIEAPPHIRGFLNFHDPGQTWISNYVLGGHSVAVHPAFDHEPYGTPPIQLFFTTKIVNGVGVVKVNVTEVDSDRIRRAGASTIWAIG